MAKKTKHIKVTDRQKAWNKKSQISTYNPDSIETKTSYLIVCEGQTEEVYFNSIHVTNATVKAMEAGCTKTSLVDCAHALAEGEDFNEVWVVFDMDIDPKITHQKEDFNSAIESAIAKGFNVAYSNDAFELWFYLHYNFTDQKHHRKFYFEQLSKFWGINYTKLGKQRKFAKSIFQKLEEDEKADRIEAIKRAKKLYEDNFSKPYHEQNPVTLVYQLVCALLYSNEAFCKLKPEHINYSELPDQSSK